MDDTLRLIWSLPTVRCRVYQSLRTLHDTASTTMAMVNAAAAPGDSLRPLLYRLASWYPRGHFPRPPRAFIDSALAARMNWYFYVGQPSGVGMSGSMFNVEIALNGTSTLEAMIDEMAGALLEDRVEPGERDRWHASWRRQWY